jgi:hypothetical protein
MGDAVGKVDLKNELVGCGGVCQYSQRPLARSHTKWSFSQLTAGLAEMFFTGPEPSVDPGFDPNAFFASFAIFCSNVFNRGPTRRIHYSPKLTDASVKQSLNRRCTIRSQEPSAVMAAGNLIGLGRRG